MEGIKSIELRNVVLYFIASKNNNRKRVVLGLDVFDVIAHVRDALLHVRKNKPMLPLMKSIMKLLALSKRRIEDCAFLMYILCIKQ